MARAKRWLGVIVAACLFGGLPLIAPQQAQAQAFWPEPPPCPIDDDSTNDGYGCTMDDADMSLSVSPTNVPIVDLRTPSATPITYTVDPGMSQCANHWNTGCWDRIDWGLSARLIGPPNSRIFGTPLSLQIQSGCGQNQLTCTVKVVNSFPDRSLPRYWIGASAGLTSREVCGECVDGTIYEHHSEETVFKLDVPPNQAPIASFTYEVTSFPGWYEISTDDTSVDPDAPAYDTTLWDTWSFEGGDQDTIIGFEFFDAPGDYNVTLVVEDELDTTATITQRVHIPVPGISADFEWEPTEGDPNTIAFDGSASESTAVLDNEQAPITTYTWTIDGQQVASGPSATLQQTLEGGTHEVTLKVRDNVGQEDSVTKTVEVEDALEVRIEGIDERGHVGEAIDATIVVSADAEAEAPITAITPAVATALVSSDDGVVVRPPTQPIAPFSLAPGESESFPVKVDLVEAGPATLSSEWSGTNGAGGTSSAEAAVDIEVVELAAITIEGPQAEAVGEPAEFEVTLKALDPAHAISATLDLTALEGEEATDKIEIEGPDPEISGQVQVPGGQSRTFTYQVTGTEAVDAVLEATATGRSDDDFEFEIDASKEFEAVEGLAVILALEDDGEITLEEDEEGPQPAQMDALLKIRNLTGGDVTDLRVTDLFPTWPVGNSNSVAFPREIVSIVDEPTSETPRLLGDLAEGEELEVPFTLVVSDDGRLDIGGHVVFDDAEGTQRTEAFESRLTSIPKYLARFELVPPLGEGAPIVDRSFDDTPTEPWNTPELVGAGKRFRLLSEVQNLTTDQDVMVDVDATDLENLSAPHFRDDDGDGLDYPTFPMREVIEPGSTVVASAFPTAVAVPDREPGEAYGARVTYVPGASAMGEDDTEYPDVDPEKVLLVGSAQVSAATIVPNPMDPDADLPWLGRFAVGWVEGSMDFAAGLGKTAVQMADLAGRLVNGALDPATYRRAAEALAQGVRIVNAAREIWFSMTIEEQTAFLADVTAELVDFLRVKTPELTVAALQGLNNLMNQAAFALFNSAMNDPGQFFESLGSLTGHVVGELTIGIITDTLLAKLFARAATLPGVLRAEQFLREQAAAATLKIEKGLTGIRKGTVITDRLLAGAVGITRAQREQLQAIAKKFGVNIYARSRGSKAIEWVERGLAVVKPYFVKPKNVNDIDRIFLGMRKMTPDTVALRKPPPWDEVISSPEWSQISPEQRTLVAERWLTRNNEWFGDKGAFKTITDDAGNPRIVLENGSPTLTRSPYDGMSEAQQAQAAAGSERQKLLNKAANNNGEIELDLVTEGNWEEVADGNTFAKERVRFTMEPHPDDPDALVPRINGKFITGDVDLVAITFPSGAIPPQNMLIEIYKYLQQPPLNMQHSATLTWTGKGSVKLLGDHVGDLAEPLVEFNPFDFVRAVKFDDKMSLGWAEAAEGLPGRRATFLEMAGGQIPPVNRNWARGGALGVIGVNESMNDYHPPSGWRGQDEIRMNHSGPITRQGSIDSLEVFQEGAWRHGASASSAAGGGAAPRLRSATADGGARFAAAAAEDALEISVQSALRRPVAAGSTVLPVVEQDELVTPGVDGQEWFQPGDQVLIDPGGPDEHAATVESATADSITLTEPVPGDLLAGTMVTVVTDEGVVYGTFLDEGPASITASPTATMAFSAADEGASFECSFDGADWAPCESPLELADLAEGGHTFRVRAVVAGIPDETPVEVDWLVDLTGPTIDTTAVAGQTYVVGEDVAVEATCADDLSGVDACVPPDVLTDEVGEFTAVATAIDRAGNQRIVTAAYTVLAAAPGGDPGGDPGGFDGGGAPARTPPRIRGIDRACPPAVGFRVPFVDIVATDVHEPGVGCAFRWGLAKGFDASHFGPTAPVTREQMATFIARLLAALGVQLPVDPPPAFRDDSGVHERAIDQLAALGVVDGRDDGTFGPRDPVTREQMATFLARAYRVVTGKDLPAGPSAFTDVGGVHQPAVDALAGRGVAGGRADGTFGPGDPVQRRQMATFLSRFLDLLVEEGRVAAVS